MCGLYTVASQVLGVGHLALQCMSRTQTRQRFGVRGDICVDAASAVFCTACAMVQEAREVEDEEMALRQGGEGPEVFFSDEEEEVEAVAAAMVVVPNKV